MDDNLIILSNNNGLIIVLWKSEFWVFDNATEPNSSWSTMADLLCQRVDDQPWETCQIAPGGIPWNHRNIQINHQLLMEPLMINCDQLWNLNIYIYMQYIYIYIQYIYSIYIYIHVCILCLWTNSVHGKNETCFVAALGISGSTWPIHIGFGPMCSNHTRDLGVAV